ncbi:TPA: hypothetical protein MM852_003612 [Salmonella enterica subsp. enterica]|nr:hypothetical protein [Salmonella enterica subsp. enterica]
MSKDYKVMRGAIASPRHILAASKCLAPIKKEALPKNHLFLPKKISNWLNNRYGNCVTAEEAFAKACQNPEVFISDKEVYRWARAHNALNGAYISQVLHTMTYDGFIQDGNRYNNGRYYSVNWRNPAVLKSALIKGPVKIGVSANQLEKACRTTRFRNGWVAQGFRVDERTDHCISICGYGSFSWLSQQLKTALPRNANPNTQGYALFTWGSIGMIDQRSLAAITSEAWLRIPTTITRRLR